MYNIIINLNKHMAQTGTHENVNIRKIQNYKTKQTLILYMDKHQPASKKKDTCKWTIDTGCSLNIVFFSLKFRDFSKLC